MSVSEVVEEERPVIKVSIEEAFRKGFDDFQFFTRICLPQVMDFDLPPLYISIWLMLVKAQNSEERARVIRFALALPRGFAKTTFIKLLVCWLIVYDKVTFALVVCATEALAENFVADVNDMLGSPNMERIYGAWKSNLAIDNKQLKKASYRRRVVIVAAIGSGTSVRGLNIAHERPDFLICDDMQTKENSDSDAEALRLLQWFTGTLLRAVDPIFTMVVYVGNMYPKNCILFKLKENPYWTSLVTGAILSDGNSLWEELHPLTALYEGFKHDEALGLAHIWFAEMMNDPINDSVSLLPDGNVPASPFSTEAISDASAAGFAIIDPSGFRSGSDDNVIGTFLVHKSIPYMVRLEAGNFNPLQVIQKTVEACLYFNIRVIFIEAVAYQQTLKFWFEMELKRTGLKDHFILVELSPKNRAKEGRIRVSVQQLLAKTWYIADLEARQRYVFQAMSYKIGKPKNKDDILDVGAYVEDVRAEHWDLVHSIILNKPTTQTATVQANNTPF